MTREKFAHLRHGHYFGPQDARDLAEALGADYRVTGDASKQGGGGERTDYRWPDGMAVDLREFQSLDGTLRLLARWRCWVKLILRIAPDGAPAVYYARLGNGHDKVGEAEALDPLNAIWLAVIDAGLTPHRLQPA